MRCRGRVWAIYEELSLTDKLLFSRCCRIGGVGALNGLASPAIEDKDIMEPPASPPLRRLKPLQSTASPRYVTGSVHAM